ncbi:transcriptional regulator [Colletotrichum falcatum]|nr:transcriptional regulator [Colletotrichum falcatum]
MGPFAFSRPNDDVRVVGNYSFRWTKDHIPKEKTEHLRQTYDEVGAAAVARILEIHQRDLAEKPGGATHLSKLDLFAVLQEHHGRDEALGRLWDEVHAVPDWVDWEQLARGQRFFYRYAAANLMGFALQGFVGENSASAGVVEVLVRTGGFRTRVLFRRLLETFQMLLEVTHSLEYVRPGGRGHATAVRVRLLHSMVRRRILKIARERGPSYYDVAAHGVPINTLDSLHALTTFACNHAFIQLPLMGISVPRREVEDYVALWRYIGHVLGTPTDHFASAAGARVLMDSMSFNERLVTDMSLVAGHNFVETVRDLPPVNLSAGFIEAGSRVLNGDDLCDRLGMGRPGAYHYACFRGFCWLVRTLAAAQRWFPRFGDRVVDYNREILHMAIIQSQGGLGGGSKMEFKHVPDGTLTGKEDRLGKGAPLRFYERPLDLACFLCFVLGSLFLAGGLAVAAKVAMRLASVVYYHAVI